jgi:hypothetical protein
MILVKMSLKKIKAIFFELDLLDIDLLGIPVFGYVVTKALHFGNKSS